MMFNCNDVYFFGNIGNVSRNKIQLSFAASKIWQRERDTYSNDQLLMELKEKLVWKFLAATTDVPIPYVTQRLLEMKVQIATGNKMPSNKKNFCYLVLGRTWKVLK